MSNNYVFYDNVEDFMRLNFLLIKKVIFIKFLFFDTSSRYFFDKLQIITCYVS
jgi:hypothetical protein